VVSAVVGSVKLTKVLMDGGSVINILYKGAFEKLNVEASKLCPSHSPLHGIVPGRWVMPLGTITLSITFGDQVHYRKETLSFEVIDFEGPYHVITVAGSFQYAYECERLAIEQAQWDLILDEPKHTDKDKHEAGSGMP
jgi:hypothetical protein